MRLPSSPSTSIDALRTCHARSIQCFTCSTNKKSRGLQVTRSARRDRAVADAKTTCPPTCVPAPWIRRWLLCTPNRQCHGSIDNEEGIVSAIALLSCQQENDLRIALQARLGGVPCPSPSRLPLYGPPATRNWRARISAYYSAQLNSVLLIYARDPLLVHERSQAKQIGEPEPPPPLRRDLLALASVHAC